MFQRVQQETNGSIWHQLLGMCIICWANAGYCTQYFFPSHSKNRGTEVSAPKNPLAEKAACYFRAKFSKCKNLCIEYTLYIVSIFVNIFYYHKLSHIHHHIHSLKGSHRFQSQMKSLC